MCTEVAVKFQSTILSTVKQGFLMAIILLVVFFPSVVDANLLFIFDLADRGWSTNIQRHPYSETNC